MDAEPEPHVPETYPQQEQFLVRLQPETDIEERLVRQLALCSAKLEHIEALLSRAAKQLRNALAGARDELSL